MPSHFVQVRHNLTFSGLMAARAILAPVALGSHALIVDRSGKVLLARHSYKFGWSLPGGGVNRGEPPQVAVVREVGEEIGDVRFDPPVFAGLFTRKAGWATNMIVLYRLENATVDGFKPNAEVREIVFCDPLSPPSNTAAGTRRRLAEYANKTPPSLYW